MTLANSAQAAGGTMRPWTMRLWRVALPLTASCLLLGLAGCSHASKTLGLTLTPPDAYEVATEAPLSMPPDLNTLPQPQPGQPRPQQESASGQAEATLAPQTALANTPTTMSPGQSALLAEAGPRPPAGIRAKVDRQAGLARKSPGFLQRLMGSGTGTKGNATVNAGAEQKRLDENAALGKPPTTGQTPQGQPGQHKGLLNEIFGIF